jgi:O-Antigen ligase
LLTYWLLLALLVSLPFEPIRPTLAFGFFNLNHLKLLEGAIAIVWIVTQARRGAWRQPSREFAAAALFLTVALGSALLADNGRAEAVKFVGRLASGMFMLLVARQIVQAEPARIFGLLWAIAIGAGASALLGLGEMANDAALEPVLQLFKLAPTRVGPDIRLSASFQYATIAAVYFELAAPLALILAATEVARWRRILATAIAAVCSVAVVLTLTRGGIVALGIAFGLLIALAFARPRWRRLAIPTIVASVCGLFALGGLSIKMRDFSSRLATENDWGWYAATYEAPGAMTVTADDATDAVVTARNTGQVVWTAGGPQSFALGYRWLSADATAQLDIPATVLELPHDVAPGEAIALSVDVAARLPPGEYRLAWGMLQQHVLWFHDRGHADAETLVHVVGDDASTPASAVESEPRSDLTSGLPPMPRGQLWSAALAMFRDHPLLGVGADNFRHLYGRYLGMDAWDDRVHANNLYLELLADTGVLGALAFGALVALPGFGLLRGLRRCPSVQAVVLAGLGASLLAYFLHSGIDGFLDFTGVSVLFWVIVGLAAGLGRHERSMPLRPEADLSEGSRGCAP